MESIKISVLMATYNSEKFISKSIESIIKQSYLNYEFIIVDDGSLDSTKEIIDMYRRNNNKIKLITKSNSGLTETLNFGMQFCTGEWIARIDSDDLSSINRLKKQIEVSQKLDNVGLIGSDAIFIDKLGKKLFEFSYPSNHEELKNNLLGSKKFFPHSSAFFNRELVESLGGYRNRAGISEDWDLWLRIASRKQIINIKKPLVKIRLHNEQISKKYSRKQAHDTRIVIISDMIYEKTGSDPIEIFTDNEFKYFKNYIVTKLEKLGFSEYLHFISTIKNPFLKKLALPLIFLKYIFKPFYLYAFIKFKFFSRNTLFNIANNFQKHVINES